MHAASMMVLLALLSACNGPAPTALPPHAQLAKPLEAAYRQFADPSMAALERSCDTAPIVAQSLEGWTQAVEGARLQSRFNREIADAKRHATEIRSRCADAIATSKAQDRPAAPSRDRDRDRARNDDARPAITADMLDAYARGVDEEIALMRATGSHFVSLSKYDEHGRQVAAKAGLSVREYSDLKRAVHKVLQEKVMHERYAGPAGQSRLAGLEPHKREYAEEVLARDPYASVSAAERDLIQKRIVALRYQYDGYMGLAAIAD